MKKSDKIMLFIFKYFGIICLIISIIYAVDDNYLKLQFVSEIGNIKGDIIDEQLNKHEDYNKYIHLNNPGMYMGAVLSEDLVKSFSVSIKLPKEFGDYIFYTNGMNQTELDYYKRVGVNLIFDKNDITNMAIDDWWYNLWPSFALFILFLMLISISKVMTWVLE